MHSKEKRKSASARAVIAIVAMLAVALVVAACGGSSKASAESSSGNSGESSAESGKSTSGPSKSAELGLKEAGTLTVGMNLQFKPEMYLEKGQPAGYDVELLKALAPAMGAKLKIENLEFNGLIPGLQAGKFDMVSVGLTPTPEREKAVSFTKPYVPYVLVLAVAPSNKAIKSTEELNQPGKTVVALQGSSDEILAKKLFPKAKVEGFSEQNAAFLQVATGRANAIVVEEYLLAQYQEANPNKVVKASLPKPLEVQYGAWAVPKGNTKLVSYLNGWLCEQEKNGTMATIYKKAFKVSELPPMKDC